MAAKPHRDMVKITRDFELEIPPNYIIDAARKVVAARARGPEDCRLLLDMLGLSPSTAAPSSTCLHCGKSYARSGPGRASCFCSKRCHMEKLREEQTARGQKTTGSRHAVKRNAATDPGSPSAV
jgi:endogenous inhibitor of DNA gyrase (YacG/DUF329 family)